MKELFELIKNGYGHVYDAWTYQERTFENISLFGIGGYHRVSENNEVVYVQRGENYLWAGSTELS